MPTITHLAGRDIKGRAFKHDLAPITIFTGANGAGKTTRLTALDLALRGPRKEDTRYGDAATVTVSVKVAATVHPSCRIDVMRTLSPKHGLSIPPLSARSTTGFQGLLDGIIHAQPAAFDLGAFVDLSPDKQRTALLPYATFVPATQYAGIYPSVVPYQGEAGSDYLTRVRAAIGEECRTLAARKLAAERAQVELANSSQHSARPADAIRRDIEADRKILAGNDLLQQRRKALGDLQQKLAVAKNIVALVEKDQGVAAQERDLPDMAPLVDALSDASMYMEHFAACDDYDAAQRELTAAKERMAAARAEYQASHDQRLQLEPLALTAYIESAVLTDASPDDVCKLVAELRNKLRRDGFPAAGRFESTNAYEWLKAALDEAQDNHDRVHAQTEFLRRDVRRPAEPREYWEAEYKSRYKAHNDAAVAHSDAARAHDTLVMLKFKLEAEREKVKALELEADAALRLVDEARDALDGIDVDGAADRLVALEAELATSMRAEGKVEAERAAYQTAEAAKAALDVAKAAEKAAKAASEDCLVKSLGAVAEAFQPCCQLLGGVWRLGDDRPLGLERDGVWVQYEHLSESERLVYGIGLVMALSTLGNGLRLVLLDGLDSCDVARRRGIIQIAKNLIAAGKLDNVLGTAWSSEGFDGVQVVEVTHD